MYLVRGCIALVAVTGLLAAHSAKAGSQTDVQVDVIQVFETFANVTAVGGWGSAIANESDCSIASQPNLAIKFDPRTPGGQLKYKTLLAAKLSGKSVQINTDGCYQGRPSVSGVALTD